MKSTIAVLLASIVLTGCASTGTPKEFDDTPGRQDKIAAYRICNDMGRTMDKIEVEDSGMQMRVTCK